MLCALALLVLVWSEASATVTVLDQRALTLDSGQLSVLEDPGNAMDLAAVMQAYAAGDFIPIPAGLSAGYSDSAFWISARVLRPADAAPFWALMAQPSYLDQVDAYWLQHGRLVAHWAAGDMQRDTQHDLHPRLHLVGGELPTGELQLLVRLKTTSTSILLLQLIPQEKLAAVLDSRVFSEGFFIGLLVVILLINLLNGFWLRKSIFLYFVAYEAGLISVVLLASGLIESWFVSVDSVTANKWMQYALVINGFLAFVFFYRLLSFVSRYRRLIASLFMCGIGLVALALFMVLQERFTQGMAYASWGLMVLPPLVILPLALQWRVFDSEQIARVSGFLVFSLLVVANALYVSGLIPMSRYSIMIAPLLILSCQLILHFVLMFSVRKSERVLAQTLLEARQAEDQASLERQTRKMHETFTAMFSHEVRTPLAIIDSAAQSLLRLEDKADARRQRELRVQRLRDAVKRIGDLLQISIMRNRFDPAGDEASIGHDYDLLALTEKLIDSFPALQQERIRFNTSLSELELHTSIPEELLGVVLRNLLDNALKYSPSLFPVQVYIAREEGGVCWAVRDFGPGLSEHVRKHMFDRYFRANEGAQVPGLGLGLYIVNELVWRYALKLDVDSGTEGTRIACYILDAEEGDNA
ncbi:sensor histidine kinase [Halopseudomonas salegens]|uniref:sensor histidine kinase n=1 Tax=Halopseudomonas salegens TaxID=1434072 RepID=UPI001E3D45ED|nr:7TM-DISM domain-containing protein [Halopseudomonas salegens]